MPDDYQDPLVVQLLRDEKAILLAEEDSMMRAMAERWIRFERDLEALMIAAATEIQLSLKAGQVPDEIMVRQYEHYSRLIYQAHKEMHQYIQYADETIKKRQERLIELGISSAAAAILAVYRWAGINGKNYIAKTMMGGSARSALEVMIGLCADGTPLNLYLQRIYGDATIGLTQALIDGIAQGLNPIEVARRMRDGFGMGMNHALNTARTETLRAYRISSLETYRQSGVVKGWKRIASHDGGTCAGCLLTEGEFYEIQDNFDEHNQGRCGLIPVVEGVDEPVWLGGKDWFLQQSDQKQVDILGQGRFDAWKNGVSLDAMVTRVSDPVWGGSFIPTPVDQLNNE